MVLKSAILGAFVLAISAIGFAAPSVAQVHTGGSNFTRAGVPHEGDVLRRRGASGEFGCNNPWVPGSERACGRRGGYGRPMMRPRHHAHPRYASRPMMHRGPVMHREGGPVMVRRTVVRHGGSHQDAGGRVIVTGQHRNVELRRGEDYAVAQRVPLTPGATQPSQRSPYENIGSKDGSTYFLVNAD